jgi:two-component system KDP operon response regulator KdpE
MQLPDRDGVDFIRKLRLQEQSHPILAISSPACESHKRHAFDAGADDFLTKPFLPEELLARLKVALRRIMPVSTDSKYRVFRSKNIEVDFDARQVGV